MTLIADSGSTKTSWVALETGSMMVTEGLNPHLSSDDDYAVACNQVRQHFCTSAFHGPLYFYGAGCGSKQQRDKALSILHKYLGINSVHVESDLLGACRALCGREKGLVGILGTGSNACFYDGNTICYQVVSTGYILGDQGSANHVGRQLLHDYLTGALPDVLSTMFHERYPFSTEHFLDAVYHRPHANRFLASLARFAVEHQDDDACHQILKQCLSEWFRCQVEPVCRQSGCRELSLVGGFAARLGRMLPEVAKCFGVRIIAIATDPVEGLLKYHSVL